MDNIKVNLLKFLAYYDYLDLNSHDLKNNEIDLPNGDYEKELYDELFNQIVQPKIREFYKKGMVDDQIIFNFFCRSDNSERILLSFYNPDIDYEVIVDSYGDISLVNTLLMLPKVNN